MYARPVVRNRAMTITQSHDVVKVGIDALTVDQPLKYPIRDENGTLLLAEGVTLTTETKNRLKARGVLFLLAHPDDVQDDKTLKKSAAGDHSESEEPEPQEDSTDIPDSGRMVVKNSGPPMRDKMVVHGCKAYDPGQRTNLVNQHLGTSLLINSLMDNIPKDGHINGEQMVSVASDYLVDLIADVESILTTKLDGVQCELADHCRQMSVLGMAIGLEMGLDEKNVRMIGTAGLLHDWGMMRVPERIRYSQRVLTPIEFLEIKKHPTYIWEMLEGNSKIEPLVRLVCYQIHERPNGTGYPCGRTESNVHLFAKILHVAHIYARMTAPKPYRAPFLPYVAMENLLKQAKVCSVDPIVVRNFLQIMSLFPLGSFVELSDGSIAHVLRRSGNHYVSPVVQIVIDNAGNPLDSDDGPIIDLATSDLTISNAVPAPVATKLNE